MPPFIAVSHVWSDALFPVGVEPFRQKGFKAVKRVILECYPRVKHCWIDTFCIDQTDHEDKMRQVPLMHAIFGQAAAVAIVLNITLGLTQEEIDNATERVQGALQMRRDLSWKDDNYRWMSGQGRERIMDVADCLVRFTRSPWASRVWTLQEFILAKEVVWIGEDLFPLKIDEDLFVAIPEICAELEITDYIQGPYDNIVLYFRGMANMRSGGIDRSRVMELLGNRQATVPVDEVFGAMAASGITIEQKGITRKEEAWRLWWEKAVTQRYLRWILSSPIATEGSSNHIDSYPGTNCIMPSFATRHLSSVGLEISSIDDLGQVKVEDGVVTLRGRYAGVCRIGHKLGEIHHGNYDSTNSLDILKSFAAHDWDRSFGIAQAFGGGNFTHKKLLAIAQILLDKQGTGQKNNLILRKRRYANLWLEFIYMQTPKLNFLQGGPIYLAHLLNDKYCAVIAIVTNGQDFEGKKLLAIDLGAKDLDQRAILTIVEVSDDHLRESTSTDYPPRSFHKVGMAATTILGRPSRIKKYSAFGLSDTRIYPMSIGGKRCFRCGGTESR